ncbi:UvrD-helicase domain-containing protein, partial [Clostridium tyrobutyricum]
MNLRNLLNKEQYEAVTTIEGPLLILAGAGSGKTRVLTYRIAHMIQDLNIYPSKILAITFTNKAAGEMKDRVKALVGNEADNMWISTFHSSCVRILRREIDKLGYNKNFAIYDSYDQKVLIKQCMEELDIDEKYITGRELINKISSQKDNLISAERYKMENESNLRLNKVADVYMLYQKKLKNNNALDFDDLIYKTVQLFKENSDVLEFYQRKFQYIMIDEYQDTNKSQYELVELLAKSHKNICVVGDDDQCIYEWRGADIRNILDFEKDYPNTKVIKLEQNYRSKANILKAANDIISNNSERKTKVLRTENDNGDKIKLYRAYSDIDEGMYVSSQIKKICREQNKHYRDFAILYRTNAQSRVFEDVFMKSNIPYRIVGGLKFYDRKEIKDIMSYLKFINNPLDDVSLRRIINEPKRSIGNTTVDKVQNFAASMDECMYSVLLDIDEVLSLPKRSVSSIKKFVSLINSFIRSRDKISVSSLIKEVIET